MEWRLLIITITLVVTYVYVKSYHYWSYNIKVGILIRVIMSTPVQRGTKALDDMRKSIFAQSTRAIATNPALISEIFTINTPREIELLLTHLQIDIDLPANTAIKKYIIDYGDDYLTSPVPTHASSLDGLSMTYFSPGVRALAMGFQLDSDQYVIGLTTIAS